MGLDIWSKQQYVLIKIPTSEVNIPKGWTQYDALVNENEDENS